MIGRGSWTRRMTDSLSGSMGLQGPNQVPFRHFLYRCYGRNVFCARLDRKLSQDLD